MFSLKTTLAVLFTSVFYFAQPPFNKNVTVLSTHVVSLIKLPVQNQVVHLTDADIFNQRNRTTFILA